MQWLQRRGSRRSRWESGLAFLTACGFAVVAAAAPVDRTAWQWQHALEVNTPGITRLDLPPATLGACQPSLADLRLITPAGVETPWLLEKTGPTQTAERIATGFKATMEGRTTVLRANQEAGKIVAVTLESPARTFLKSLRIEGSDDGADWQPLAANEVIFRQADGVERLCVPFEAATRRQLRVIIDDDRSAPVAFTGLRVTPAAARVETVGQAVTLAGREEVAGETRLTVALGAGNLHLAELRLEVPEGVFSRHCEAVVLRSAADGSTERRVIASGTLYWVIGENGGAACKLAIPIHQRVASDRLLLTIRNGDSPPLAVLGLAATRYPDRLVFFAGEAGKWNLLTGNRRAVAPDYDLTPLRSALARAPGTCLSPGPLLAKADYQPPPALPEVAPAGSEINLTDWACRRALQATLPGIVTLELDAVTLAHMARSDLGDLRLIQNDKQIPWLLEASPPLRALQPQVAADPDPKRPTLSRWKFTLPVAGLPVHLLTADSPDPLFTRHLRVLHQGKDELGNPWTRVTGAATWTKAPGASHEAQALRIDLGGARVPDTLWLETDNGDNPPLRLGSVEIRYQAPSLVAKITDPAPLFLYYDNPRANPPVYDLGLVRAELLAADKQTATLGNEEMLDPDRQRDAREVSAGSPWLWTALAVVVIALLFIVAKLLPKQVPPA